MLSRDPFVQYGLRKTPQKWNFPHSPLTIMCFKLESNFVIISVLEAENTHDRKKCNFSCVALELSPMTLILGSYGDQKALWIVNWNIPPSSHKWLTSTRQRLWQWLYHFTNDAPSHQILDMDGSLHLRAHIMIPLYRWLCMEFILTMSREERTLASHLACYFLVMSDFTPRFPTSKTSWNPWHVVHSPKHTGGCIGIS